MSRTYDQARLLQLGADLISEEGENPEYDRGVTELVAAYLGIPMDYKEVVLEAMQISKNIEEKTFVDTPTFRES